MKQLTIAVVTGTRAEYGLLRPVLEAFKKREFIVSLVVTGAHLSKEHGMTVSEIEQDHCPIAAKIDILKFGAGRDGVAKSTAYATEQFVEYFIAHRPDAVLVLGDRYEIFAAGTAASLLNIPLGHISGGDVTQGAADDWFRHCLTKMAGVHFPSCEAYAHRLLRMGEEPRRVHNVGGLGDENLRKMNLLDQKELESQIFFSLEKPFALVTYHPETASGASAEQQCAAMMGALEKSGMVCIFTKANADADGEIINRAIGEACHENPDKYVAFTSMGSLNYLSAMKYCALVVGNSSSGVVETPSLGVPTVNIGTRQQGRILCDNVLCCDAEESAILRAIEQARTPQFIEKARKTISPYNGGDTAEKIATLLEEFLRGDFCSSPKAFYDGADAQEASR